MPGRRYMKKQTRGKSGVKHAGTNLVNSGSGSVPTKFIIIESAAGDRTEGSQTIQQDATTDERCRTGDLIKFVNIHIQCASRVGNEDERMGWLEYACVWKRGAESDLSITQLGVQTLGETATNLYRNDCIWTGFVPIGLTQPNGVSLALKMPKSKQFLKLGEEFVLFTYFRSQNSASVATTSIRQVNSFNYKAYS